MMAAMSDWSSALERRLDLERANRLGRGKSYLVDVPISCRKISVDL
jgi:hypothetical protein